ncbi:3-oxo-Delta(4,5)-steroid 5-beta-reductase-like [Durio zibethinus]|uniref:3-oxo-Delta(4,5)-steroid 5-beta-reductase-like n=1 Tax=Durio zibethinus TaxID=66656 RepID=A0A6P5XVR2_DURZI|nr:3-oxo-Delta(4,5)-steroid 5-beta-reductase-like [Durio zibethinus]
MIVRLLLQVELSIFSIKTDNLIEFVKILYKSIGDLCLMNVYICMFVSRLEETKKVHIDMVYENGLEEIERVYIGLEEIDRIYGWNDCFSFNCHPTGDCSTPILKKSNILIGAFVSIKIVQSLDRAKLSKLEVMADRECNTKAQAAGNNVAIIFGVTGLVGKELSKRLISKSKWKVYGVARNPEIKPIKSSSYHFISCDLLDPVDTKQKLSVLQDVTHMFWITWASQHPLDSPESCEQNKTMMCNALSAILPIAKGLKHFSLQTGMSNYVPVNGKTILFDEEWPRGNGSHNFYYVLEDLLHETLAGKVAWSVHRPGLLIGASHRTFYNFIGTLCVYGATCKHLNLPFVFGGTRECWEESYIDGSDARLVAEQQIWAATTDEITSTDGQAFNAINGSSFTWKQIWPTLGEKFGVTAPENMFLEDFRLTTAMREKEKVWEEIVMTENLHQTKMKDLANWQFLDLLFRCPGKLLGSRAKVDQLGFTMKYNTLDSILYWIDFMRDEKLIP